MENKRTIGQITGDIKAVSSCIDTLNVKDIELTVSAYLSKGGKISDFVPIEFIGIEIPKEEDIIAKLKIKLDSLTNELNKTLFAADGE